MQIFVVCQNDFPVGAFSKEADAVSWCTEHRRANDEKIKRDRTERWSAFHWHGFVLDESLAEAIALVERLGGK